MRRKNECLVRSLLAFLVVTAGACGRVPSSRTGTWSRWRGDASHTGYQPMPGRIAAPGVKWRFPIGGMILSGEAAICPGTPQFSQDTLIVSPWGRLEAFTLNGRLLWQRRSASRVLILGCWDLGGDGRNRILGAVDALSAARLVVFDAADGRPLWTSSPGPSGVGSVKVLSLTGKGLNVLWLPAASNTISAFSFDPGGTPARTVWTRELSNFVSDPYSNSALAATGLRNGRRRVIVSGARWQITNIVLDGGTGAEISRHTFSASTKDHGFEAGGSSQLLHVEDENSTGRAKIVTISNYDSRSTHMFQGITVAATGRVPAKRSLDSHPVGLHFVSGSVRDFDGDGLFDILVSRYDTVRSRHDLLLLDGTTLRPKATMPDFHLKGIVLTETPPLLLGTTGVRSETSTFGDGTIGVRYERGRFRKTGFVGSNVRLATPISRPTDDPSQDNAGPAPLVLDGAPPQLLVFRRVASDPHGDQLCLASLDTGQVGTCFSSGPGIGMSLLGLRRGPGIEGRIVVAGEDGSIDFLDQSLRRVARVSVGGYARNPARNGHTTEIVAVGRLRSPGENDVVVLDSRNRVLRLTGVAHATPATPPSAQVLGDNGVAQELLLVANAGGTDRIAIRGYRSGRPMLSLCDATGHPVWVHLFPADAGLPVGINAGHFRNGRSEDVVVSVGAGGSARSRTCVLEGTGGRLLWCSSIGSFWDAALAVRDLDADGLDDIVFNFNNLKASVLSGRDGRVLAEPGLMPDYRNLGAVDYNGAPILMGPGSNGMQEILDAEDNAHLSLFSFRMTPGRRSGIVSRVWDAEQANVDDQRYSMATAVPFGREKSDRAIGVGAQTGVLESRRNRNGVLLWRRSLEMGSASKDHRNALSSVLGFDANGDGRADLVVGGSDGWLYAFDAATGAPVWSMNLEAPVGDPIAADIDDDGIAEILVPVADGFLYAIGPKAGR